MNLEKREINTVDNLGKNIKLLIIKPGNKLLHEANMQYHKNISELIKNGINNPKDRLLLRSEVDDYLIKNDIWTRDDLLRINKFTTEIQARELLLRRGGINLSEARTMAIEINEMRNEILQIYSKRQQLDSATVESHAENYRFEFLIIKCVMDENNHFYFKDHNDYIDRNTEQSAIDAAKCLANMIYNLEENINMSMFEMKWLKEAGYVDEHGRYINKEGKFIDKYGKLVNEEGKYINDKGELVNNKGQLIDVNGKILINSSKPFIDDETGKEIVICGIGSNNNKSLKRKKKKQRGK